MFYLLSINLKKNVFKDSVTLYFYDQLYYKALSVLLKAVKILVDAVLYFTDIEIFHN